MDFISCLDPGIQARSSQGRSSGSRWEGQSRMMRSVHVHMLPQVGYKDRICRGIGWGILFFSPIDIRQFSESLVTVCFKLFLLGYQRSPVFHP